MMFFREVRTVGRQSKQVIFINIIIAHIMYFLSDICWALILGGYLPKIYFVVTLVNILNAVVLSMITGFWFVYVELSQGEESKTHRGSTPRWVTKKKKNKEKTKKRQKDEKEWELGWS